MSHLLSEIKNNLRYALDELYLDVVNSNDILRSKNLILANLEKSIKDLHHVSSESWKSKILSSLKVEVNIPNIGVNALAGAALSTGFGLAPELGAAIGAASGAIKFEITSSGSDFPFNENTRDYTYAYYALRELHS